MPTKSPATKFSFVRLARDAAIVAAFSLVAAATLIGRFAGPAHARSTPPDRPTARPQVAGIRLIHPGCDEPGCKMTRCIIRQMDAKAPPFHMDPEEYEDMAFAPGW